MWQTVTDFVMTYLDPVSTFLGVILAIPVFATWYTVTLGEKRRRKRWFREIAAQPGSRPGILILDLLDQKEIHMDVEHFRQQDEALESIPEERIIKITRMERLKPEDMPELIQEIREKAAQLMARGVDVLHYFHAGPSVAAALIGAEFANSRRVILYQHKPGGYDRFGPLRLEE